ncbi:efflux RND transporter periplasmic adaptor subunit [Rhodanobacter ginsenosidimutans]|uniref:Efflux RND transporter periplasmic adaptor subunit n=1 Tax=Rhodanobacter ginsenosidimutans TaxID=490571 RepID=A0ABW0K0K1_9GAMM
MKRACAWLLLLPLLGGCKPPDTDHTVLEQAQAMPLEFSVLGEGDLQSTKPTPLLVPGAQWTSRQLNWMLPDGSMVAKGDLVARFSAEQSKQDLAQARIDLERNLLARAAKQAELDDKNGQLDVDLTQVIAQYVIAERYANATLDAIARNDILDAVQDVHYLDVRQRILHWREDQSTARGVAELAVLDAQRSSFDTVAKQKKADLDALELRAPHAGILVLEKDWTNQVPHVGSSLYAGNAFANLPDLDVLEVRLTVPQIEAQGIKVGDKVELHRWGMPAQTVKSTINWVASTAQQRSRVNPVKYLMMKMSVPAEVARKYGWLPGQRFVGKIILLQVAKGYSVPNVALGGADGKPSVKVLEDGKVIRRTLKLGVRGATRTQVLEGLRPGDRVLLGDTDAEESQ